MRVACEVRPTEVCVACEVCPVEVRVACEVRPAEVRDACEVRPTEVRVACEVRPAEVRVACEVRPTEVRVACEGRPVEVRVACEGRPTEVRIAFEGRPVEVRVACEVRPTEVRVACEGRPAEVRVAFEFGSAKIWDTFESGIREVHGFVECGFMEIERASAPQLVVIHRLHDGFSGFVVFPFLAQSVAHDGEDGGFHGLVRCSRFDEMAGSVLDGLSQLVKRVIRAIGSQIAAQDVHHALTISTLVSVRDVRQRVDARDARGGLVGAQLVDGGADLLVCDAGRLALLGPVLDDQICDATDSRDGRQGALNGLEGPVVLIRAGTGFGSAADARARCRTGRRPSTPPFHQHGQQSRRENDPYGDRHEQRELPHPFLRRPPEQPQDDGKHEDTQTQQ